MKLQIFIDSNNLKNRIKEAIGYQDFLKFDIDKFITDATNGRELIIVNYYTALPPKGHRDKSPYKEEIEFINKIKTKQNYRVHTGHYDIKNNNEKETDVNICVDMLVGAYSNSYDVAVLVSADQDYKKVVNQIRSMGKIVELCLPQNAKAGELIKNTDYFNGLTNTQLNSYFN